jgi:hypothetical protein
LENQRLNLGHGNLSYDFGAALILHRVTPESPIPLF